jgi:hypothetical protein
MLRQAASTSVYSATTPVERALTKIRRRTALEPVQLIAVATGESVVSRGRLDWRWLQRSDRESDVTVM